MDLKAGRALPEALTVNIHEGDGVIVQINAPGVDPRKLVTEIVLPGAPAARSIIGPVAIVDFVDCSTDDAKRFMGALSAQKWAEDGLPDRKTFKAFCPGHVVTLGGSAARVLAESPQDRTTAFLRVGVRDEPEQGSASIAIRLVKRRWKLAFSAGLAAFGIRDERFVLDQAGTDKKLRRISDGEIPYSLATFVHYDRLAHPVSLSFGFATKVPIDDVTMLMGASVKLKTLPLAKSGFITAGIGLTRRSVLAGDFEAPSADGKREPTEKPVPSATTIAALTEKRRDWTWFLAFTFGFAGGGESDFAKRAGGQ